MKIVSYDALQFLQKKLDLIPVIKKVKLIQKEPGRQRLVVHAHKKTDIFLLSLDSAFPSKVEKLIKENKQEDVSAYLIIAAPYISERSAEICKKYEVGYIDYSGNCFLSFDIIYISDQGHKNLFSKEDKANNIFRISSTISSRILRELMKDPTVTWRLKNLSETVGCSIGMVSRVKNYLCHQNLAVMDQSGLKVTDTEALMKVWTTVYEVPKDRILSAFTLSPIPKFEKDFSDILKSKGYLGCLTGFSGGARYAPVVRYSKVELWIAKKHLTELLGDLNIKLVETGANVVIHVTEEEEVLIDSREINGSIVASPVQVYLDLKRQKGRGEEMADNILLKEILK